MPYPVSDRLNLAASRICSFRWATNSVLWKGSTRKAWPKCSCTESGADLRCNHVPSGDKMEIRRLLSVVLSVAITLSTIPGHAAKEATPHRSGLLNPSYAYRFSNPVSSSIRKVRILGKGRILNVRLARDPGTTRLLLVARRDT